MEDVRKELDALRVQLGLLTDRMQIQEAVYHYCRGADRLDEEVFASAFWPDGRYPDGPPRDTADQFVPRQIRGRIKEILVSTHHMMGNILIELDGNQARVETYAIAHHRTRPTQASNVAVLGEECLAALGSDPNVEHSLLIGFRYVDRFEKRLGIWKIAERRLVFDWSHAGLYAGLEQGGLYAGTPHRGRRDRDDVSYVRSDRSSAKEHP